MSQKASRVDLNIPMVQEMELAASQTAAALAQFAGLEERQTDEVRVALIEACLNAFEHSRSKDGRVRIEFDIEEHTFTVRILDTGKGFDPEAARQDVEDRRARGESRRGWGLRIIEELMDDVSIDSSEKGTAITMSKRRPQS